MTQNSSTPRSSDRNSTMDDSHSRWVQSLGVIPSPSSVKEGYQAWMQALSQEPAKLADLQQRFIHEQKRLMDIFIQPHGRFSSGVEQALASTQDKRFAGEAWQTLPQFRYVAESYLSTYRLLLESVENLDVADDTRKKMRFFVKQHLDAMSPANFLATNPEALQSAFESKGETLKAGLENLQQDMEKGHISMTDEGAFKVGENIAMTPGSVVFENEIFQLVQYTPLTKQVHVRPLLIVHRASINSTYSICVQTIRSCVTRSSGASLFSSCRGVTSKKRRAI